MSVETFQSVIISFCCDAENVEKAETRKLAADNN